MESKQTHGVFANAANGSFLLAELIRFVESFFFPAFDILINHKLKDSPFRTSAFYRKHHHALAYVSIAT